MALAIHFFNPFYNTGLSIPTENIRKPMVFRCFQGVQKETSGIKWVKIWLLDEYFCRHFCNTKDISQLTFTCSKSTIETLEKSVRYVQSQHNDVNDVQKRRSLCTFSTPFSSVFLVNFEQVNVS